MRQPRRRVIVRDAFAGLARGVLVVVACGAALQAQDSEWARAEGLYREAKRPVQALSALVEGNPRDPWAHYFHGQALAEAKRLEDARAALSRAESLVQHDRERGFLIGRRAEIVLRAGDLEEAERLFGRAATLVDEDRRDPLRKRRDDVAGWREESEGVRQRLTYGLLAIVAMAGLGLFLLRRRR